MFARTLTPWGWALAAAVAGGAMLIALHGLGFRWDPFGLAERRLRTAEARTAGAVADASARRLEVEALNRQTRRLEEVHRQSVAVARLTARTTTQARSAHDADIPLDPSRAARLAGHDRELCDLAPSVCGAATTDPAPGGAQSLHPGAGAGAADAGGS